MEITLKNVRNSAIGNLSMMGHNGNVNNVESRVSTSVQVGNFLIAARVEVDGFEKVHKQFFSNVDRNMKVSEFMTIVGRFIEIVGLRLDQLIIVYNPAK